MIRTAVVATSPMVRAGLEALLGDEADVHVVLGALTSYDDGAHMSPWEQGAALAADVVLWAPDAGPDLGPRVAADLSEVQGGAFGDVPPAQMPALVVVADLTPADAVAAVRAGARAVLPTASDATAVGAAVQAAAAGLVVLPVRDVAAWLAPEGATPPREEAAPRAPAGGPLSAREREVLALLAEGLANKQIAHRMSISEHTVKAHVAAIFAKLHAGTRAEAVVTAARRGLLML